MIGEKYLKKIDTIILFFVIKALAMLSQIISETIVLHKKVVNGIPHIRTLLENNSTIQNVTHIRRPSSHYLGAAYTYSIFYIIGLACTGGYWYVYVNARKKDGVPIFGTLVCITCDMPAMVCDMIMMKSKGAIDGSDTADLFLQVIFCTNLTFHIFMDIFNGSRDKDFSTCTYLMSVSFLLMCPVYAPVTWSFVGWHWLGFIEVSKIKGITFCRGCRKTLNVLMFLGQLGQFLLLSFIIVVSYLFVVFKREENWKKKKQKEKKRIDIIPEAVVNNFLT